METSYHLHIQDNLHCVVWYWSGKTENRSDKSNLDIFEMLWITNIIRSCIAKVELHASHIPHSTLTIKLVAHS